jgi:hypothetical protein
LSAGNVTFLGLCSPLVATVLGWAFLGQSLTPWQAVGAAIVVIAVITAQRHLTRSPGADLRAQTVPVMDSSAERPGMDGEDASAGNSRPSASRSS